MIVADEVCECVESVDANGSGLFNAIQHTYIHWPRSVITLVRIFSGFVFRVCDLVLFSVEVPCRSHRPKDDSFPFSVDIILQCRRARVGLLNVLGSHIAERAERTERAHSLARCVSCAGSVRGITLLYILCIYFLSVHVTRL